MKDTISRQLGRFTTSFAAFTTAQKVIAVLGTAALLLGGFMVFRWASAPSYAPLFSNLSSEDASAVIENLDSHGVPYEITGGGGTIMVPRDLVYETRIDLSGEGLPTSSEGGYSLFDEQSLSTSEFQEQTTFKRAMEGELSKTIEGIDDVQTAVVHLALPEKQVFAEEQAPATASVLLQTRPGTTLAEEQVQAVVHLVASSIDGMKPEKVTVADSTGKVLTTPDGSGAAVSASRNNQQQALQNELQTRLQAMLDRVVGAGNSTVQVTADLDFDKTTTKSTEYTAAAGVPPISQSSASETYTGPAAAGNAGGVVGPDGQMEPVAGTGEGSSYEKNQNAQDNPVNTRVEERETAPGALKKLGVGIVLDSETTLDVDPAEIRRLVAATISIDNARGDSIQVSSIPFDRTAEAAVAEELAAAAKAEEGDAQMDLIRKAGLGAMVLLMLLLAWFKSRRRAKARAQATTYVVEQLKAEQQARAAVLEPSLATLALEQAEKKENDAVDNELSALIERQPEDVAALLRGWLVERP